MGKKIVGSSFLDKSREHVAVALEQELKETDLTNQLDDIKCPVLVIKGLKKDSLLKNEFLEEYRTRVSHLKVIEFEDSGHNLWKPDYYRFINVIDKFMEENE